MRWTGPPAPQPELKTRKRTAVCDISLVLISQLLLCARVQKGLHNKREYKPGASAWPGGGGTDMFLYGALALLLRPQHSLSFSLSPPSRAPALPFFIIIIFNTRRRRSFGNLRFSPHPGNTVFSGFRRNLLSSHHPQVLQLLSPPPPPNLS